MRSSDVRCLIGVQAVTCVLVFLLLSCPEAGCARSTAPPVLHMVADVPLPGATTRFDYQSYDPTAHRLYISHMGDGALIVFDTLTRQVVAVIRGLPSCTGVRAVPALGRVFVSSPGLHAVAVYNSQTLQRIALIHGPRFPDGIAWSPADDRVFVSDESGRAVWAIDAVHNRILRRIPLDGEAGNTHYDSRQHLVYTTNQTANALEAIDPVRLAVKATYPLAIGRGSHGWLIDEKHQLAYITCEDDASLLVFNLATHRIMASYRVGAGPDVLRMDANLHRLYVACESGVVNIFRQAGDHLAEIGSLTVPAAHTVELDPNTGLVYLALKDIHGHAVLRILREVH
ncbi:MAG: YncE family protein [Armatimonadetes bacterium]|nr:YncE family protein [Armatimonadota bacterium]MDE2206599.1 YncE family protein [Armatimonadota bacterium]